MYNYLEQIRENLSRNLYEDMKLLRKRKRVEDAFFFYKFWYEDAYYLRRVDEKAGQIVLIQTVRIGTRGNDAFEKIKEIAEASPDLYGQEHHDRMVLVIAKLTNIRASIIAQRGRGKRSSIYGQMGGGSNKVKIDFMDFIWEALMHDCDYEYLAWKFGCSVSTLYRRIPPKQLQAYVDVLDEIRQWGVQDDPHEPRHYLTDAQIRYRNNWPKELD